MNNTAAAKKKRLIRQFQDAVSRFNDVLQKPKDEYIRDSAIQRFEFTFELAWKVLKACLEEKGLLVYSPRDAFRGAFQVGLIENEPGWLEMVETRNLTAHVYDEKLAEEVYDSLSAYLPLFQKLAEKTLG
jgi:nucleotidyltransferase substrate binding protein (TIGR01987 family)